MRRIVVLGLTISLVFGTAMSASAGTWQRDSAGWWYLDNNGSYPRNTWQQIGGIWYCFDGSGYMLHDTWSGNYYLGSDGGMLTNTTTPDGYWVGVDGKWSGAAASGSGQDTKAQQVISAYKEMIRSKTWNSNHVKADRFCVVDINGDGLYEAVVERQGKWVYPNNDANQAYWQEVVGSVLYYSNGGIKTYEYGDIEVLDMVDTQHSRIWFGRTRGKAIDTVCSFSPVYGVTILDSWFLAYGYAEDEKTAEYYMNGMREVIFVDANEKEFEKYLTGTGCATGFKN